MTYDEFTNDIEGFYSEDIEYLKRYFGNQRSICLNNLSVPIAFTRNFTFHALRKGINVSLFSYTDSDKSKSYAGTLFAVVSKAIALTYDDMNSGRFKQNGWTHDMDPSATDEEIYEVLEELFSVNSLNFCLLSRTINVDKKTNILGMARERGNILYWEV